MILIDSNFETIDKIYEINEKEFIFVAGKYKCVDYKNKYYLLIKLKKLKKLI